jgi:hypothetical protein
VSNDIVAQVKARSPRRVLDDLAPIAGAIAGHGRARPEIELMLATGASVRGRFVSLGDDRDGVTVVVQVGGSPAEPSVAFVRVDQVVCVIVPDAGLLVRGPVPDSPIPSKLELARQAAAKSDQLAGKLGHPVSLAVVPEIDDDGRRAAATLLPLLADVLAAIAGDDMGKQALAPITAIELSAGSTGDIGRHGATLVVRAPRLLTEAYTRESLRAEIEKIL